MTTIEPHPSLDPGNSEPDQWSEDLPEEQEEMLLRRLATPGGDPE